MYKVLIYDRETGEIKKSVQGDGTLQDAWDYVDIWHFKYDGIVYDHNFIEQSRPNVVAPVEDEAVDLDDWLSAILHTVC